jgi:hypothetical protein
VATACQDDAQAVRNLHEFVKKLISTYDARVADYFDSFERQIQEGLFDELNDLQMYDDPMSYKRQSRRRMTTVYDDLYGAGQLLKHRARGSRPYRYYWYVEYTGFTG